VRRRLVLGAAAVVILGAASAHFFIGHSLLISQNWLNCNEDSCSRVYYVQDKSLVNAEALRHYCAAYDLFTNDVTQDIARAPGTMQVAFKPHPDAGGRQEFVTEALIPASQAIAQRTESAAEKVPDACARSLSAQYLPAGQYQPFTLELSRARPGKWEIQEDVAIAYNGKYLIIAKADPDADGAVAGSAVECTLDGGPVTSTDADSGTATNCESNLPW
jgi:hypothetical protein